MALGFKGTGINATSHGRLAVIGAFQRGGFRSVTAAQNAEVTLGCGCVRHPEQAASITTRSQALASGAQRMQRALLVRGWSIH